MAHGISILPWQDCPKPSHGHYDKGVTHFGEGIVYWTVLLTPLFMILGIAYSWRYWRNKRVGHILLTVILYGTVALLWLFGVPLVIESPIWPGIRNSFPELAYGLIAGATLGIGWSVTYTAMNLRVRKSK